MEKKYHTPDDFCVRFAETDSAKLAHFTNFLRWAENAEGDFFRTYGASLIKKDATGVLHGFPRVSVKIDYRAPAHYADRIRVRIRPQMFPPEGSRSIDWEFQISRIEKNNTETLLAYGSWKTVFATIDAHGNVKAGNALPDDTFAALKKFFGKS
ncbi:MAG: hypothetical protein IKM45_04545 [Opitutales bacterium]|nr:hypothetical protein [Opitutales bacterium]